MARPFLNSAPLGILTSSHSTNLTTVGFTTLVLSCDWLYLVTIAFQAQPIFRLPDHFVALRAPYNPVMHAFILALFWVVFFKETGGNRHKNSALNYLHWRPGYGKTCRGSRCPEWVLAALFTSDLSVQFLPRPARTFRVNNARRGFTPQLKNQ